LKAPGTKRLKLKYDEVLSRFAFKFNLRRYIKASEAAFRQVRRRGAGGASGGGGNPEAVFAAGAKVGRCRFNSGS